MFFHIYLSTLYSFHHFFPIFLFHTSFFIFFSFVSIHLILFYELLSSFSKKVFFCNIIITTFIILTGTINNITKSASIFTTIFLFLYYSHSLYHHRLSIINNHCLFLCTRNNVDNLESSKIINISNIKVFQ